MLKRAVVQSACFVYPKGMHWVKGNIPQGLKTPVPFRPQQLLYIDLLGVTLCLATQL